MNAGFRWILEDHAGDVAMVLRAGTAEGLFSAAAAALLQIMSDPEQIRAEDEGELRIAADDLESLLVAWLNELIFLFETRRLFVCAAEIRLSPEHKSLRARLTTSRVDPARHPIKTAVKAATHHLLEVRRADSGDWTTRLVLDL